MMIFCLLSEFSVFDFQSALQVRLELFIADVSPRAFIGLMPIFSVESPHEGENCDDLIDRLPL